MASHAVSSVSSKQRSCNACVQSKRRCDKRAPTCTQCVKKKSVCMYRGRMKLAMSAMERPVDIDLTPDVEVTSVPSQDLLNSESAYLLGAVDFDMGLESPSFQVTPTADGELGGMTIDFLGDFWQFNPSMQQELVNSSDNQRTLIGKDYSKMANRCDGYQPWQLADSNSEASFAMRAMKSMVPQFAKDSCTPFLHRHLYKDHMPHCILDAFAMCVLYVNQNESNRAMILRVLHDKVSCLLETSLGSNPRPQERLARVHALILYQCIRMLDGDVTLGAQADNDLVVLEAWLEELCSIRDNLEGIDISNETMSAQPPESWERWIFAESVRRAYVFGHALITFWNILKMRSRSDDLSVWSTIHRWTLSSHLWNASDSYVFFEAWRVKPFFVISCFNFDRFLMSGCNGDVDEFARFFLTIYCGVSAMKEFADTTSPPKTSDPLSISQI